MEKELATKIQKIVPKLPDFSQNIAKALVIEPDDEVTREKKGTIYTVFDISGKKELDVLLVTKVVNDVLHDAYYQSDNVSPIQSIEKAILKLRDNITQIAKENNEGEPMISFNIGTTILWGNTLYVVQYGNTHTSLMRDGAVKPISSASEGNFSVASGAVKDNDVVILATEDFTRKFPPDKLVGSSELQMDTLDRLEAGLMMKFLVVKNFSKDEIIDFGSKTPEYAKTTKQEKEKSRNKPKIAEFKKTFATKGNSEASNKTLAPLIGLFVLLTVIGIVFALYRSQNTVSQNNAEESQIIALDEEQSNENEENNVTEEINEEEDRINRVKRVEPNVFYDIQITNTEANPASITLVDNILTVSDTSNGKLYTSETETPKFVESTSTFEGAKNLIAYEENIALIDNGGFKILNPIDYSVIETYDFQNLGITTTYIDFIYSLNNDTITRYTKGTEEAQTDLEGTLWTQNEILQNAKSMAVNISIYVLGENDELLKFTTGELEDFEIEGIDKPFSNSVRVVSNPELEFIYVADAGNKRIVVLTSEGVLVRQYKLTQTDLWSNIKDIAVNLDETTMYVLDGSKVYEVELQDENTTAEVEDLNEIETQ